MRDSREGGNDGHGGLRRRECGGMGYEIPAYAGMTVMGGGRRRRECGGRERCGRGA